MGSSNNNNIWSDFINFDDLSVIPEYQAVANVKPLPIRHYGPPEADWNPTDFGKIRFWSGVQVDEAQVLSLGQTFIDNITSTAISTRTAIRGLKLAMSLRSMNPGNTHTLLVQQQRETDELIPDLEVFDDSLFTLSAGQRTTLYPRVYSDDTNVKKVHSYCFIAAYLMKLLVKSPDNVVNGLANMKSRFESFYGYSSLVRNFTVTKQQASIYKEALKNQRNVGLTYTHAIANTHQNAIANYNPQEISLLSYLCFEPFSYTGMHAYKIIMDLKNYTKMSLDKLLALFNCNVNSPALLKISYVYQNLERTEDVTFRYCTLWGSHYFQTLRSKNSAYLVYTVACAWKEVNPTHENSNPENIAAVGSLPTAIKGRLKAAGVRAGEALKAAMHGGTEIDAFALNIYQV